MHVAILEPGEGIVKHKVRVAMATTPLFLAPNTHPYPLPLPLPLPLQCECIVKHKVELTLVLNQSSI